MHNQDDLQHLHKWSASHECRQRRAIWSLKQGEYIMLQMSLAVWSQHVWGWVALLDLLNLLLFNSCQDPVFLSNVTGQQQHWYEMSMFSQQPNIKIDMAQYSQIVDCMWHNMVEAMIDLLVHRTQTYRWSKYTS